MSASDAPGSRRMAVVPALVPVRECGACAPRHPVRRSTRASVTLIRREECALQTPRRYSRSDAVKPGACFVWVAQLTFVPDTDHECFLHQVRRDLPITSQPPQITKQFRSERVIQIAPR